MKITVEKILSETPKETIDKVRETTNELVMKEPKKVMSAYQFIQDNETLGTLGLMEDYANYILSQRIDELAERIAENGKVNGYGFVDKSSILKIANDYKTELNL